MDLFEKAVKNIGPLGQYANKLHGYFTFPKLEGDINTRMLFNGKEKTIWALSDYLGIASIAEVKETDVQSLKEYGLLNPMGSRITTGHSSLHEQLEVKLAAFSEKESAFVLNNAYQGMISIIDAIADRKDVIIYDSDCNAGIIDGARLHIGKRFVYQHNNIDNLKKQLERASKLVKETGGIILVITQGVFELSGSIGRIDEIIKLKKEFRFRLMVDDSHGIGVLGATGRGIGEHFGLQASIDIYFSSFENAFVSMGAYVASKKELIRYLAYNMRSQTFAGSLSAHIVAGIHKRLEVIDLHPEYREQLLKVSQSLQSGLRSNGFNTGNSQAAITTVYFSGDTSEATHIAVELREKFNIFCHVLGYPVIPKGMIQIRFFASRLHTLIDVRDVINAMIEIRSRLENGAYYAGEAAHLSVLESNPLS